MPETLPPQTPLVIRSSGAALQYRQADGSWVDIMPLSAISGVTFLRQISVSDSAAILGITAGTVDKRYACAGAVVGERYLAHVRSHRFTTSGAYTAGRPANYWLIAADCQVADTINIVHQRPAIALLGGQYDLLTDILRVNA